MPPSETSGTSRRPLHRRLIRTASTHTRRERDLGTRPYRHWRRKDLRFCLNDVARNRAGTGDDGRLDARYVRLAVGVGEATDIATRRAGFADCVAGSCGDGVGDGGVEGKYFFTVGGDRSDLSWA